MSKNSYSRVGGENVRLLQALIDEAPSYTKPTNSRNANILKSIINNTEYNEPPQSEIEELLIALKAKIGGEIEVNELTVTENGSYDAGLNKAYNPVNVELPLDSKEITANGTYNASEDNLAGFSQVTVNVEGYKLKDIPNTPTAIATFSDGADLPMPKLEVGIEPVQEGSGDPSPENIRPISGWDEVNVTRCGKNLIDVSKLAQQVVTSQGDVRPGVPAELQAGTYTISAQSGSLPFYITRPSNNYSYISINALPFTFSLDNEEEVIVRMAQSDISSWNYVNLQLEEGTTPTTYEPYNGQTYTIDLDGTRYGGKVDLVSGVMTVDRGYVDLGTLTWGKSSTEATVLYTAITGKKTGVSPMICDRYKYVRDKGFALDFGSVSDSSNASYVGTTFIRNSDFAGKTAVECATLLSGTQLVYELATPLTIQLPTTVVKSLRGVNNISADSGDVLGGKYFAEL
jgi:hypothetical protein